MLNKSLLVIIICSLSALTACSSINSAIKDGNGNAEEVTKIGTPIEAPVPETSNAKSVIEQFIKEHPKWEGNYQEDGKDTDQIAYLQFDIEAKTISMASSLADGFRSFGFEVLEDGSIKTAKNKLKIGFEDEMETMSVFDSEVDLSLKMYITVNFGKCGEDLNSSCQDGFDELRKKIIKEAISVNKQILGVTNNLPDIGGANITKKANKKSVEGKFNAIH